MLTRRKTLRILGGTVGAAALPLNFACDDTGGAYTRNSLHEPTPGSPLTPAGDFYVTWCCGMPEIRGAEDWRLHLTGLVDRETTLGWGDLMSLPRTTRTVTLECVGNDPGGGLMSSAEFTGVRLDHLFAEVGLSVHARGLQFHALEGYAMRLPRAVLDDGASMVAFEMNGEPLLPEHGAPARALFPGRFGMFSVKWLDSVAALRTYAPYGAFQGLGDPVAGRTGVRSRLDRPDDGQSVPVGEPVEITGLAVTPGEGVSRVQVRADGEWQDAELTYNTLADPVDGFLWTLWRFRWTPRSAGRHVLAVRAFDRDGETQSDEARYPYDSTRIHAVRVVAR